ncbi:MAG: AMP-binding protein, partial [Nitrospirae bacterium]|nr:AMP-binding protein [Nitrospirota bacterium]
MKNHNSLIEALDSACVIGRGIRFIEEQDQGRFLSSEALRKEALAVLYNLQSLGLTKGDKLIFQIEDNETFISVFWACIAGGIIPVPVAVGNNDEHRLKLFRIWQTLENPALFSNADTISRLEDYAVKNGMHGVMNDIKGKTVLKDDLFARNGEGIIHKTSLRDVAFIQFSSGSTGDPKGVVLTHGNLLENIHSFSISAGFSSRDIFLSWFPLTHDMGLIGWHILPLLRAIDQVLMPTKLFVRRPATWMTKAAEHRATVLCSPNFGYKHFLKLFKPEHAANWDLSSIRTIVCGAEPLSAELCEEFLITLAPYGMKRSAVCPGYGLAEATLAATISRPGQEYIAYYLDRGHLNVGAGVKDAEKDSVKSVAFVDVGYPLPDMGLRISDGKDNTLDENVVGHIEIKGASVTDGYYNNREASEAARSRDGWFDTGDLGFLRKGRLVITGRAKEVIIINGANYYPHDIERVAEAVQGIDLGKVVACGVYNQKTAGEELIVFAYHKGSVEDFMSIARRLKDTILEKTGLSAARVIPIKKVPKTTSGKIQRVQLRDGYINGKFDSVIDEMAKHEIYETEHQKTRNESPDQSGNSVLLFVKSEAERILGIEDIDISRPLIEQGFNSIMLVEFHSRLASWSGVDLPVSIVFDYPTVAELAGHLSGAVVNSSKVIRLAGPDSAKDNDLVAVIGLGCRFPGGADSPDKFWQILQSGIDTVTEIPAARWNADQYYRPDAARGLMYTKYGSFISGIDRFDSSFFNITPVEAESLDPQQRLLLEVTWEALENAGQDIAGLNGSQTGVFVGITGNDYVQAHLRSGDAGKIDPYSFTGTSFSTAAGRISYVFGFHGPAIAIDTACSSSLVAVHLAVQGLRNNEISLAVCGGVNLILSPEGYIGLCQLKALSGDGRCKAFDASADGYGRGEGCGIVVLKRLSDAERDGDNILAVVRGSAVNHDGRSNGFTVPNGVSQQRLIRSALKDSGVGPDEVNYIEAHGTGTVLGDPLEVNSLVSVFGDRDKKNSLIVGTVKANIGHLEGAAGIAGFIKTVLCLRHRQIPLQPNFREPNKYIPWDKIPLLVPDATTQLNGGHPCIAGISSFGFSGTNAHVILQEQADVDYADEAPAEKTSLLTISAKNGAALKELAGKYSEFISSGPKVAMSDMCYTSNTGRSHLQMRIAVLGKDDKDFSGALSEFAAGNESNNLFAGREPGIVNMDIVFLFTGQGSQYPGMGKRLYDTQPVFRESMNACSDLFKTYIGRSIIEMLYGDGASDSVYEDTSYSQPMIFSLEYSLCEMWKSWGVTPAAVVGHSIGEYVAACAAGVFSREDAVRMVAMRGRLMQEMPEGVMVAAFAPEDTVSGIAGPFRDRVAIAAVNSPDSVVISGEQKAVDEICDLLKARNIKLRKLPVARAFHSPLMNPMVEKFGSFLREIVFSAPSVPLISNITGDFVSPDEIARPAYWSSHILSPVLFYKSVTALQKKGYELFLEIGASPVLSGLGRQCVPAHYGCWISSLRNGQDDWQQVLGALAALYVNGAAIDWKGFHKARHGRKIALPTYPFQRQRYWINPVKSEVNRTPLEIEIDGQAASGSRIACASQCVSAASIADEVKAIINKVSRFGVEEIDENKNLFELGLDSLMLTQLRYAIDKKFGLGIPMSSFYQETDTVAKIAAHIEARMPRNATALSDDAAQSSRNLHVQGDQSSVERLMSQQIQAMSKLMSEQIEFLKGVP